MTSPADVVAADPSEQQQEQKQDKDSKKSDDEGSADAALGLINSTPVQLKTDLEEPVTSGGIDIFSDGPGTTN